MTGNIPIQKEKTNYHQNFNKLKKNIIFTKTKNEKPDTLPQKNKTELAEKSKICED